MNYCEYLDVLSCYLEKKHWHKKECLICGSTFFCKDSYTVSCCNSINIDLISKGIKKKKESYKSMFEKIDQYFANHGYKLKINPNVHNIHKDTAFIVAAVQRYNYSIEHGYGIDDTKIYCPQPCIRLRELTEDQLLNGFMFSFVNVATLKLCASMTDYLEYLDDWIGVFSALGIHASRFVIKVSLDRAKIQSLYQGWNVDFIYNGLELGQCTYFDSINGLKDTYTGIDCGFSMERMLWIINGGSIWDQITPADINISNNTNVKTENLIRTIVLALMSGILPGASGDRFHTQRLIIELLSLKYDWILIDGEFEYYYSYWKRYVPVSLPIGECKRIFYSYSRKRLLER